MCEKYEIGGTPCITDTLWGNSFSKIVSKGYENNHTKSPCLMCSNEIFWQKNLLAKYFWNFSLNGSNEICSKEIRIRWGSPVLRYEFVTWNSNFELTLEHRYCSHLCSSSLPLLPSVTELVITTSYDITVLDKFDLNKLWQKFSLGICTLLNTSSNWNFATSSRLGLM